MQANTTDTMEAESAPRSDSAVAGDGGTLRHTEGVLGSISRGTWQVIHSFPGHGAMPGFALGLGASMLVGVGELAVGCFTAYVGYRIFAYGESLTEAVEKAIKFESGKLEQKEINKPVPE